MYRYKKQKANNVESIKFCMMCCFTHRVKFFQCISCICLCLSLCSCVLFRSPPQREPSCLSPIHSTSAREVLKPKPNRCRTTFIFPCRFTVLPLHLSLNHNMTVLVQGLKLKNSLFQPNSWEVKCDHIQNQFDFGKIKQFNFIT